MESFEMPNLVPYLAGVRFEKGAIEQALKSAPCPIGYHYVVLENCDVMLASDETTPEPLPNDESIQREILGDPVVDALKRF